MAYAFFLGANSKDGFVSLFPALQSEDRRLYAVKGGPGCGKSTLIGRLADRLGGPTEYIYCSSDPGSLDGALLEGIAILDGTSPHVLEPTFPGCGGDYLPLPPLKDTAVLAGQAPALYALQAAAKAHYAQAYRLLKAAALLREGRREHLGPLLRRDPLSRLPALLREIPKGPGPGRLRRRFLDGLTPRGPLCLWDTVSQNFDRVIALEDPCGLCAPLLTGLLEGALARGQLVYGCYDPLEPDRLLHLLLPDCSLAFITRREALPFAPARTIHPLAAIDRQELRRQRTTLRLKERMEQELLADATGHLAAAHSLHDRMEAIYKPHLDLQALDGWEEQLLKRF